MSKSRQSGPWVRATDAGSRPTSSQYPSSTSDLCTNSSRPTCQLVASACRAAMRSVTFSPPPPTQIGRQRLQRLGVAVRAVEVDVRPSKVTVSSVQSRLDDLDRLVEHVQPLARPAGTVQP